MGDSIARIASNFVEQIKNPAQKLLMVVLAFLGGCSFPIYSPAYGITPDYGVQPPPGDPTVEIIDFSYEPGSPVEIGSTITFQAALNKRLDASGSSSFLAVIGDSQTPVTGGYNGMVAVELQDHGQDPDEVAGDLVYTGSLTWHAEFAAATGLPVIALIDWYDQTSDVTFIGEQLTVIEPEAE